MSETAIVDARDVVVRFGHGAPAVAGASLQVEPGGSIGIVGESGSGKTTFARTLVGALNPTSGTVRVGQKPWREIHRKDPLRRRVQMVFQDPYGSLTPRLRAIDAVAEVFHHWDGCSRGTSAERAREALLEVGLPRAAHDRLPAGLSGGQCQRVGIARALACSPDVLVADEPTSSLDVSVQAQILNLILDLQESRHLALVLISHDLAVVRYATAHVLVMYKGAVVEEGPTGAIFDQPSDPYTRTLIDSLPGRRPAEAPAR
jgi:ABC-type dipeptide/oligopeptide/nickel transport system ATPase subunit